MTDPNDSAPVTANELHQNQLHHWVFCIGQAQGIIRGLLLACGKDEDPKITNLLWRLDDIARYIGRPSELSKEPK